MRGWKDFGTRGRQEAPARLFYEFDLAGHVPANHVLHEIDLFIDGDSLRDALRPSWPPIH
ncbi:hypothetical protein ACFQ2S_10000 [Tropicimonas aquimaris]|uniref:Uncharacterized protein n=1 Tax=Tropicimonas aquimaris TaxID=914152 RepID=A0ABW3IQS0_9RHOB